MRQLLSADALLVSDAGGKAPLWGEGIFGADRVARLLSSMVPPFLHTGGTIEVHPVNGQPGAVLRDSDGRIINTLALDVADGHIQAIRAVTNPDKLGHVGPVADAADVLRQTHEARRSEKRPEPGPDQAAGH